MKKALAALGICGLAAAALAAMGAAMGRGAIDLDGATGFFDFGVRADGNRVGGSLRYAVGTREGDELRLIIELPAVQRANFEAHSVTFAGPGVIRDRTRSMRVMVEVHAFDGGERGDAFGIVARDPMGNVVYGARGPVAHGNIAIRTQGRDSGSDIN